MFVSFEVSRSLMAITVTRLIDLVQQECERASAQRLKPSREPVAEL